mgnify:FL=1
MGFYDLYNNVFIAVKNCLENVSSIKQINLGEALRLQNLPLAVISPRETSLERGAFQHVLNVRISFDVVIIIRETEPSDWFDEIISVMCDAFDALMSDDTLNGAVKGLTPTLFAPGEITALNRLYYGGLLRFEAFTVYSY